MRERREERAERRRGWVALPLALGAALFFMVARDSARLVGDSFPGFLVWDNGMLVSFHMDSWTGPRASLPLNGGRILEVEGEPFRGGAELRRTVAALPNGEPVRYRVATARGVRDFAVPSMRLSWGDYATTFGLYLMNGASFLLIAVLALYVRPDLAAARSLAVASGAMGLLLLLAIDYNTTYRFVPLVQAVEAMTPAALAHFILIFPVRRLGARTRGRLLGGIAGVCAGLGAANITLFYSSPELARLATYCIYLLIGALGIGMVASFGETLLQARDVSARLRAAVVFAGGLAGLVLPAVSLLAFFLLRFDFSLTWATVLLPLFPLSIVYAVMRHDLLQAERFVRLSVGYSVATIAVVVGYAVVLLTLKHLFESAPLLTPGASFVLLIAAALGFDPLRRRVQAAVNRWFFRSSVDAAAVLQSASQDLAALGEEGAIARSVEERLIRALGVGEARVTTDVDGPGPSPNGSWALLEEISFRGEPLGFLACGDKRSGAPFSPSERALVSGLAAQASLAIHNARSIQALRDAQETIVRTERLVAIGELAGAVAHGIRNPLAGIRATTQMALEQDPDSALADALKSVLHDAERLDQRMRTLLDFSRPFEPNVRPVDLRGLLGSVLEAVRRRAEREGIAVEISAPDLPMFVETDADYLEEALFELIGNSLQALSPGGHLRLEVAGNGVGALIRVTDDGPGIPPGVQKRIFEPFFTTRRNGTGMGLATVKKIVERQGATVELELSTPEGTSFRIDFPTRRGNGDEAGAR